jgi:hypothetical protein
MPDAKTMGRWGVALGPEVIKQIHERIVTIGQQKGIAEGRRMRVDTTVVETNIHYPTDSSLLGDGVRVLTRVMKNITKMSGEVGCKLRDRSRSVKHRVMEIGRAARAKGSQGKEKLQKAYGDLLNSTSRVVGQAKRFARNHRWDQARDERRAAGSPRMPQRRARADDTARASGYDQGATLRSVVIFLRCLRTSSDMADVLTSSAARSMTDKDRKKQQQRHLHGHTARLYVSTPATTETVAKQEG